MLRHDFQPPTHAIVIMMHAYDNQAQAGFSWIGYFPNSCCLAHHGWCAFCKQHRQRPPEKGSWALDALL